MTTHMEVQETSQGIGLHCFAVFTAICTWFLIIAGALVTSNEAGLAVPDWPLSYGSLMPPMIGGIFYEHGHRMVATTVGLLTVVLAIRLWRKETRRWVRYLGLAALGTVLAQGLLGGITVLFFLPTAISVAHGCLAQAFFCLMVSIALVTSPHWTSAQRETAEDDSTPPLRRLTLYATAAVYGQLILGAQLRHSQSGLLPHVVGAVVVSLLAGWVFIRVTGSYAHIAGLLRPAIVLIILLGIQLFLGLGSFWIRAITRDAVQPQPAAILITTAHVAIGALVLAASLILMLQSFRRLTLPEKVAGYAPATEKAAS